MLVTTLIIVTIISITINFLFFKLISVQLKNNKIYEMWIQEYDACIDNIKESIQKTYIKMKNIDDRNIFYKDDEVGAIFSELLVLLKKLNDRIQK